MLGPVNSQQRATRIPGVIDEVDSETTSPSPSDSVKRRRHRKLPRPSSVHRDDTTSYNSVNGSRHHPPSRHGRDSGKLFPLLLLTSERLEVEIKRADDAERRAMDYIPRLQAALDAKVIAESSVSRLNEELRLYKLQLNAAQKEIFRAQEVVHQVEKARLDAEAEAATTRSKLRQISSELAVMAAREEGQRQGYKEGLRIGRRMGFEAGRAAGYANGQYHSKNKGYYASPVEQEDPLENGTPPSSSAPTPRVRIIEPSYSPSSRSVHIPDVAPFAQPPPIPTVTTPVPSESNQNPVSLSPSKETHPATPWSRPRPPSPSARSVDSWIPTADRNSYIAMPPPHELSHISPYMSVGPLGDVEDDEGATSDASTDQPVLTRDQARSRASGLVQPSRRRSESIASRASTHLSELDIVSSPHQQPSRNLAGDQDTQYELLSDQHTTSSPYRGDRSGQRGTVEIPERVPVAQRVAVFENPPPVIEAERLRSPVLEKLSKRMLSLGRVSSTKSAPVIAVDPPSTSPSVVSVKAVSSEFLSPEPATSPLPAIHEVKPNSYPSPSVPITFLPSPALTQPSDQPSRKSHKSRKDGASGKTPMYTAPAPPSVTFQSPSVTGQAVNDVGEKSHTGSPARLSRPISLFSE